MPPVDLHAHVLFQQAVRDALDLVGLDRADVLELLRLVPAMVEDAELAELGLALGGGDLQEQVDRLLAHRRMRAERDDEVELRRDRAGRLAHQPEQERQRAGARAVRDEADDLLPAQRRRVNRARENLPHFIFRQRPILEAETVRRHDIPPRGGQESLAAKCILSAPPGAGNRSPGLQAEPRFRRAFPPPHRRLYRRPI